MSRIVLITALALWLSACSPDVEERQQEFAGFEQDDDLPGEQSVPAYDFDGGITTWLTENFPANGGDEPTTFIGEYDLNGDGLDETLGYVYARDRCGTGGCTMVVLQKGDEGIEVIGELTSAQLPVGVFASSTNGYRDLAVTVSGGGASAGVAKVPFVDGRYASNPTVAPSQLSDEEFEMLISPVMLEFEHAIQESGIEN